MAKNFYEKQRQERTPQKNKKRKKNQKMKQRPTKTD